MRIDPAGDKKPAAFPMLNDDELKEQPADIKVRGLFPVTRSTGQTFPSLYRLLDALADAEHHAVAAGYEILTAWESGVWHADVDAEREAYIAKHGYQPTWSARSSRTFYRWLQARAEAEGHPCAKSSAYFRQLHNAAEMHRHVSAAVGAVAPTALPNTEGAWRPLAKLLTGGGGNRPRKGPVWDVELVQAVELAAEMAEDEGQPVFTERIASKARSEIWKSAPRIRRWVEQPNKPTDDESTRDVSIRLYQTGQRHLEPLFKKGRREEIKKLRDWVVTEADKVLGS